MTFLDYVETYGAWQGHSIEFEPGKFTIGYGDLANWVRRRAKVYGSLIECFQEQKLESPRVLDVGCYEGGISYHLSRMGAEVIGMDVRSVLLGRCGLLTERFPNLNLRFIRGNMLKIDELDVGALDAIVLAGTLYHIDALDIIPTLRKLRSLTKLLIIDTHISHEIHERYDDDTSDVKLYGRSIVEHFQGDEDTTKESRLLSSRDNNYSFWMTENSMANALQAAGFNFTFRPITPFLQKSSQDRGVWVAMAGDSRVSGTELMAPEPGKEPKLHEIFRSKIQSDCRNPSTKSI